MKRAISIIIVLISIFSLSACGDPCSRGQHAWIYDVSAGTKTCSVCNTQSEYHPSGYLLDASKIEAESAMPYYNSERIACVYTRNSFIRFNNNTTEENAESLINEGQLFFVDAGTTCDIIEDDSYGPEQQVILTSGEYNGTTCWTLKAVILTAEELEEYQAIIDTPEEAAEAASQIIKATGSPIKADNYLDYEKYKELSEAFNLLYPYRDNSQCAELLMSDELILNRLLGNDSAVFSSAGRAEIARFKLDEKMTYLFDSDYFYFDATAVFSIENSVVGESIFNIKNGTQLYSYIYDNPEGTSGHDGPVIMEVSFLDVDTLVVTLNGESATLLRENEEAESDDSDGTTQNNEHIDYESVSDEDEEYWYAVTAAQNLVKDELKSPSSAKFSYSASDYTVQRSGDHWIIGGYVDAQNGFGATIREEWIATFTMGDISGSQYKISDYAVLFL